jgi:hypothetical protein
MLGWFLLLLALMAARGDAKNLSVVDGAATVVSFNSNSSNFNSRLSVKGVDILDRITQLESRLTAAEETISALQQYAILSQVLTGPGPVTVAQTWTTRTFTNVTEDTIGGIHELAAAQRHPFFPSSRKIFHSWSDSLLVFSLLYITNMGSNQRYLTSGVLSVLHHHRRGQAGAGQ